MHGTPGAENATWLDRFQEVACMLVSCESSYCRILSLKYYLMFNPRTLKEGSKNVRGFRNIIGQYNLITTVIQYIDGKKRDEFRRRKKGNEKFLRLQSFNIVGCFIGSVVLFIFARNYDCLLVCSLHIFVIDERFLI